MSLTVAFWFSMFDLLVLIVIYFVFTHFVRVPKGGLAYPAFRFGYSIGSLLIVLGSFVGITISTMGSSVTTPVGSIVPFRHVSVAAGVLLGGFVLVFTSLLVAVGTGARR